MITEFLSSYWLPALLLTSTSGFLLAALMNRRAETSIFLVSFLPTVLNILIIGGLGVLLGVGEHLVYEGPTLYHAAQSEFAIRLFMDVFGGVYLLVATLITAATQFYSRHYMHREHGYKRFFLTVQSFYIGLILVLTAGNLEILFIGWEILGITSFFLIAFYRNRYLPVKNAYKVLSIYRVADVSLLLAIWMCHHYFGHSIHLDAIPEELTHAHHNGTAGFFEWTIPFVFLLAAAVKSGVLPFSSWVSRAMEGPTPSSAIFYGALSIHIGIFLLIRVAPFWQSDLVFKLVLLVLGIATWAVATSISRTQAAIKSQIAYASVAQIGLMLVELSLGLFPLVLVHLVLNAILRAYQLLVSPSLQSHRIRDMFFNFSQPAPLAENAPLQRLRMTAYVLGLREYGLDGLLTRLLWRPLKNVGNFLKIIPNTWSYYLGLPVFLMGLYAVYHKELLTPMMANYLPEIAAAIALGFAFKAIVERRSALSAWLMVLMNQLFQALSIGFNEHFEPGQVMIYLSGVVVAAVLGIAVIARLRQRGENVTLNEFQGHAYEYPRLAFVFGFAALAAAGFPITPTFIGEDLLLGHVHANQIPLLAMIVLSAALDALIVFRVYARLFFGPHGKGYHAVASRSS